MATCCSIASTATSASTAPPRNSRESRRARRLDQLAPVESSRPCLGERRLLACAGALDGGASADRLRQPRPVGMALRHVREDLLPGGEEQIEIEVDYREAARDRPGAAVGEHRLDIGKTVTGIGETFF